MRAKLMSSAAILLGVLTFATVASAQAHPDPNGTDDSYNSQSQNDIDDSFNTKNDASTNTKVDDSFNSDSSTNTKVDDSYNSDASTNTKYDDSFNDNSKTDNSVNTKTDYDDSFNTKTDYEDSFNDNSKTDVDDSYNTKVDDSYNTDNSTNTKVDDSYNTDNSVDNSVDDSFNTKVDDSYNTRVDDSFNTDNSTTNWNIRVSLTNQDLDATVSGQSFAAGGSDHHIGTLATGNIGQDGGAFAGFAGIQTVSNNTGMGSIGQAATAVSANANVTFGNGGAL